MSLKLAAILAAAPTKKRTRAQIIALASDPVYDDGRTKQCHKDECDISKIMDRFNRTGTISHVNQNQGRYVDFSGFDFQEHQNKLNEGEAIFDSLPAEVRREFRQDPTKFFNFVNDPVNKDDLLEKLPALAKPGDQAPPPKRAASEPTVPVESPDAPDPE